MAASIEELVRFETQYKIYANTSWTSDVLKALCLGAQAVGLGRAFLFAQSVTMAILFCRPPNLTFLQRRTVRQA